MDGSQMKEGVSVNNEKMAMNEMFPSLGWGTAS
jgi:hypothetical protein